MMGIIRILLLKDYVYEEPCSIYMAGMCVFSLLATVCLGISEATGTKHLQYSKFWNVGYQKNKQILLSSRFGMLLLYTPALVAAISSFRIFPNLDIRFLMLKSVVTIHFLKRVLEVLFLHRFSGFITLDTTIIISLIYHTSSAAMLYFQHESQGFPEPSTDLKYIGLVAFLVGIIGNFYHHYLLSKLREKDTVFLFLGFWISIVFGWEEPCHKKMVHFQI
ncbi:uncharacterized protein [Henckelia pumila]|uniref:uncharacterized protein n=1 Tax=Henckelia pumila TaxID=405737 RepID=UPI003C6E1908